VVVKSPFLVYKGISTILHQAQDHGTPLGPEEKVSGGGVAASAVQELQHDRRQPLHRRAPALHSRAQHSAVQYSTGIDFHTPGTSGKPRKWSSYGATVGRIGAYRDDTVYQLPSLCLFPFQIRMRTTPIRPKHYEKGGAASTVIEWLLFTLCKVYVAPQSGFSKTAFAFNLNKPLGFYHPPLTKSTGASRRLGRVSAPRRLRPLLTEKPGVGCNKVLPGIRDSNGDPV